MNQVLDFFKKLFDSADWPPRWHCGKWTAFHGWLYIISDLLIWTAYFAIPIVILRYISRKKSIPFIKLYFLFAAFILACGATHFLDAFAFWIPVYRLSALVRFITGVISWITVFYLVRYLPIIFSLKSQASLEAEIEERKKTELELKKSRKDYELLVGGVKDYAIFMLDTEGRVASWNSGAENIKGYTADEIIGKPLDIFYTDEEIQQGDPKRNLDMALQHGRYETKGLRVRKDKSTFWADIVFSALYDEDNRFYGYAKVTRDITEKRKAEERILFLASIASNIQDPFISTDNNGNITRWNHAAELLFEWKTDEVIGKNAGAILQADYLGISREMIIKLLDENNFWQGEGIYHTKSGRPVNILITASHLKDAEGNITGNLALVRDITERKKAEDKLKEFEYFFNNSNDLSCIANNEGYFEIVNPGFTSMLGYSQKEISVTPFLNLVHPDDVAATIQVYNKVKSGEDLIHFTNRYRKLDGSYLLLDWNCTPNATTGKIYCIARDITARKKAEDALLKLNEELEQKVIERTEKLAASEMRFRMLIENSTDGIDLSDEFSNNIYRSPGAEKITGVLPKENQMLLTHPDDVEIIKNKQEELIKNPGVPIPFQARFRHALGHYIWLEGTFTNLLHVEGVHAIITNFRDVTKRKELEVLLHKANALARIGGWELDLVKGTVFWSDITREIHETAADYVPDLTNGINFYKEGPSRDLIAQKVKEAIEFCTPWDVELQIITAKNNERWVRSIGETEFADGKCIRIYGSFQDIDKRKKVEEALLLSEARARRIFESDMIGFIFWSEKGQILEANDYFLNMTGYTRQDLEKGLVNWAAMTPPEYANLDIISLKQIEATGICKPFEKEYIKKDGSRFPIILGAAALGENFDGVGVCYVMDITERKKSEIEREILNERLQLATQSAQLGLWDWDVKNNKLIWDEEMYRLYNLTENEFTTIYDGWASRVHTEDRERVDNDIQLALANKKDYKPEFRIVWPDSSVHYINASGIVERDYDGNAVRMTGFNWDVTERKTAEETIKNINIELEEKVISRTEQLRKTNEELETFSYSISHDLRAPLRGIIGFTNILEEDYSSKLDDEARRITGIIKNNTTKMGALIDDLLSFSRLGRQQIAKTNVHTSKMIAEIIAEMGFKNGSEQTSWIIAPLQDVHADTNTIRQVWVNLISNAVKYSNKQPHPVIEIGTIPAANENVFFVKDNGVGFDVKYKDKLFKVFQRLHSATEFEGTGVGLAIVEKIVTKHGGRVWAEAEPGKGACFYFSLPAE